VCAGAGLNVSGESVPYVAGWGQDDAAAAVRRFAATIDEVARRIEQANDSPTIVATEPQARVHAG
jgi:hypothetical protein